MKWQDDAVTVDDRPVHVDGFFILFLRNKAILSDGGERRLTT